MKSSILMPTGEVHVKALPKISAVHPYGSKILVEILRADEILGTKLAGVENTTLDGAPQAYIIELGPNVPKDAGLKVGQRIYWTGKGTSVSDPRQKDRMRAMLEINNILGILDEDKEIV